MKGGHSAVRAILSCFLSAALLSACATEAPPSPRSYNPISDRLKKREPETKREATIVQMLPSCPMKRDLGSHFDAAMDPATAALVAAIIPVVVAKGFELWGDHLENREKKLSSSSSARHTTLFYDKQAADDEQRKPPPKGAERGPHATGKDQKPPPRDGEQKVKARYGCILFARVILGTSDDFKEWVDNQKVPDSFWSINRMKWLRSLPIAADPQRAQSSDTKRSTRDDAEVVRFPIVAPPMTYAEFVLEYDDQQEAKNFAIRPVFLDYADTAAEREGEGAKDLVFSFNFEQPGVLKEKEAAKSYAQLNVTFPKTPIGARFHDETMLRDKQSAWQPLPPFYEAEEKKDDEDCKCKPAEKPPQPRPRAATEPEKPEKPKKLTLAPVSLLGTLVETEKAGDLEVLLVKTVNDEKIRGALEKFAADQAKRLLGIEEEKKDDKKEGEGNK